jgi:glycosyltransferase EpsE
MTKVSVIMGVCNGEKQISKAIDSILNQTYSDFEFIICDDASVDNSYRILKEYAKNDNRIILLKNETNLGLAATLNRCLEIANGEYIARMDDDDISLPERFEKQVEFLEKNLDYTILGGAINLYNETGIFGKRVVEKNPSKIRIFKGSAFIHPTVMIRKSALKEVKGYTVADYTRRTEDYDLWCKLTFAGYKGYNLQEVILNYFEGKDSYKKRKLKHRIDSIRLRTIWRKKLKIPFRIYIKLVIRLFVSGLLPKMLMQKYHIIKYKG